MNPGPDSTVIVAVGDELLGGFTLDTNSHWLAQQVREAGWPVRRIEVVADRDEDIVAAIHRAVADAPRVFVCGGVGPTTDDRTLAAVARALGRPIAESPEARAHIQGIVERMHAAGWVETTEISEANARMAAVPEGAVVLSNRRGMASGLAYPVGQPEDGVDRWLFVTPGIPREMQAIVSEEILPRWFAGGSAPVVRQIEYGYAIEAQFFEPMQILEREFPDVSVGSYPQTETRRLILRVSGADAARVDAAVARLLEMRPLPAEGD
ncbi:MAG TPA: competence/damage-inducible protein A [Candidatus Angelobacter sp.]|jgi:molybdenum cofactor synthesis domain-containing protein|nr:competence/damage-inducible protein A [Candidatus Angelobacter sp.]